jgi:hypothetical protein
LCLCPQDPAPILLIPPLIPAGIRGIRSESRNSGGIDRIPAGFLAYKYIRCSYLQSIKEL